MLPGSMTPKPSGPPRSHPTFQPRGPLISVATQGCYLQAQGWCRLLASSPGPAGRHGISGSSTASGCGHRANCDLGSKETFSSCMALCTSQSKLFRQMPVVPDFLSSLGGPRCGQGRRYGLWLGFFMLLLLLLQDTVVWRGHRGKHWFSIKNSRTFFFKI